MSFNFESDKPIFLQIIELIKTDIICGKYAPNEKLPSVREFSSLLNVNPNTVQKSFAELERMGLIYTERTNGKYVTNNIDLILTYRANLISEKINNFICSMKQLGLQKNEIIDAINKVKGE